MNHFRGLYRTYLELIKKNRKMPICKRLDLGPLHIMVEGREAVNFQQSYCKKTKNAASTTLHTKGHRSPKHLHVSTFRPRHRILEGSMGWIGMENQTMVERPPSIFFINKIKT
jgi:hypothetical protein